MTMNRNETTIIFIAIIIMVGGYLAFGPNNFNSISANEETEIREQIDSYLDALHDFGEILEIMNQQLSLKETEIQTLQTQLESIENENRLLTDRLDALETKPHLHNITDPIEFDAIYNQIFNSVVSIEVASLPEGGIITQNKPAEVSQGSGFVYDDEGHIITNHHVIENHIPNSDIYVQFQDGSVTTAVIIGSDSVFDIAILKTELPEGIEPLTLGNSSDVYIGQNVGVIGSPLGYGGSLSVGVISQLKRHIQVIGSSNIPGMIQVDASINPGNSGGPLINEHGEVIGVVTIKLVGFMVEGMGYAIPSNLVRTVVSTLMETGEYNHPYMGILVTDITPKIELYMHLPSTKGVLVVEVMEDSPAEAAGLRGGNTAIRFILENTMIGGDVIIKIDEYEIMVLDDLSYSLLKKTAGDAVNLTILRNQQELIVELILGELPDS